MTDNTIVAEEEEITFDGKTHLYFDMAAKRPLSPKMQNRLGGDAETARLFPQESWIDYETEGTSLVSFEDSELFVAINLAESGSYNPAPPPKQKQKKKRKKKC